MLNPTVITSPVFRWA